MPYASTTLAQLRAFLQNRYTGDPFWSATEANDAINESLRQFNLYTGFWRGNVGVTTTANSPFITVPGSMTYRTRVTGAFGALARTSIVGLYRTKRDWRTQTLASGAPIPTTIRMWAPVGLSKIAYWPMDSVGGTALTIEAVKVTPILTADGQFVDLGDEEQKLIMDESLWVLSFKRPDLIEGFRDRHQSFLQGCLERNDQLRASAFYRRVLGLDSEQRVEPTRLQKDEDQSVVKMGGD